MPKISIITPVFVDAPEKAAWLNEMIESVKSQSVTDWELILINDKSPLSIHSVQLTHATDTRLRWLENAYNFGPAATRNTAVAIARSDCILPLDSDDLLANPETLEYMYDTWIMDKSKTIYGNLQHYYEVTPGSFRKGKVFQLPHYSIEGAMHLDFGLMPVSTMHSKEAWEAAGGWKSDLKEGREDLEYWIACGKAGYCGQKINHTTLLYRKHEQSRDYRLKHENKQLEVMQRRIKELHNDIYTGRFPMACCGKGGNAGTTARSGPAQSPEQISAKNQGVTKITELEGYDEKEIEWVAYQGAKKGRFDVLVRGPAGLPDKYAILGTGHHFQIHKRQKSFFEARQHLGFRLNVSDPRNQVTAQPEPRPQPKVIPIPKPQLSTLVRMDQPTAAVEVVEPPEELLIEPNPAQSFSATMIAQAKSMDDLGLSPTLTDKLSAANYTIESLAEAEAEDLTKLKGIGITRSQIIIERAKELMK